MQSLYRHIREQFKKSGIENPDLEARLILKQALNVPDADFITGAEKNISMQESSAIESFVQRRLAGEPLSKIFGEKEFWGLRFKVTKDVLDPRPDTETLVEAALKRFAHNPPKTILDLGTGSGCILIALLHEWKDARGTGVDISPDALEVAEYNARSHGVADRCRFIRSDWDEKIHESFDLIVANPPYISSQDIPNLQPEVKNFDPILALDGGENGLDAYKSIVTTIKSRLNPHGKIFFEVGISQAESVMRLAVNAGLSVNESYIDLGGVTRILEIGLGKS